MNHVITGCDVIFGPWIAAKLGTDWIPGRGHVIGFGDPETGIPAAAAWFEGFNGASVLCHFATDGKNRLNREFLWFMGYYPFEQLKVEKVISPIESSNKASIRWVEKYGMTLEATLKDAAPKGDLLLYTIRKEQCKWLHLRNRSDEAQGPSSS